MREKSLLVLSSHKRGRLPLLLFEVFSTFVVVTWDDTAFGATGPGAVWAFLAVVFITIELGSDLFFSHVVCPPCVMFETMLTATSQEGKTRSLDRRGSWIFLEAILCFLRKVTAVLSCFALLCPRAIVAQHRA